MVGIARRKSFWVILICNLFLSLTVVFFQPLESITVNIRSSAFPVWSIWWIQLVFAVVITAILTVFMLFLPLKGRRIAMTLSLGLGISFLVQSLLFNSGRPLDMNTTWEMKVGCILIWFWIVLFVVTTLYYFLETREKRTEIGIIVLAWFLTVIQAVNFTMLATSYDTLAREPNYLSNMQYQQYTQPGSADLIQLEGTVLNISMNRGMPYLIKDSFEVNMDKIYDASFSRHEELKD